MGGLPQTLAAEAVAAGDLKAITPKFQHSRTARPLPEGRREEGGL
jgi:hypothetical protein